MVPVDNFYEWKKIAAGKQPYAIALADRSLMALAGLWENWRSPAGEWVRSFAIITTTPNKPCAELHNRMPVVLGPEVCGRPGSGRSRGPISPSVLAGGERVVQPMPLCFLRRGIGHPAHVQQVADLAACQSVAGVAEGSGDGFDLALRELRGHARYQISPVGTGALFLCLS